MLDQDRSHVSPPRRIERPALIEGIRLLGIERGDLLHVKVSMRSLGPLAGGAEDLLSALLEVLGEEGTLVSDAFVKSFPLPLSKEAQKVVTDDRTPTYAGAFCRAMIEHPEMVRSRHPIQKGVAIGREAERLMLSHDAKSSAYQPLHEMATMGAKHLTVGKKVIGVGTTHVAQNLLGLKQAYPPSGALYKTDEGLVALFERNWVGNCSNGFPNFMPLYAEGGAILSRGMIAHADSFVSSMSRTLEIELDTLRRDPTFFLCDDPACISCRLSWEFSSGNKPTVYCRRLVESIKSNEVKGLFRKIRRYCRFLGEVLP